MHEPLGVDFGGRAQHECSTNLSSHRWPRQPRDTDQRAKMLYGRICWRTSEKVRAAEQVLNPTADFEMELSA